MFLFRHQNHPQNDPRTLPEALWTPKWPCDPPWGLPGRLFGPQSRPKSTPKGSQRQPKIHQSGPMEPKWSPPVATSSPKAAPRASQGTPKHTFSTQNAKMYMFTQNRKLSYKIDNCLQYFAHRRPAYAQRTSPNMGRRQCYAHRSAAPWPCARRDRRGNLLASVAFKIYLLSPPP